MKSLQNREFIKQFKKLSLQKKYHLLQTDGDYVGSRHYSSYFIHLFIVDKHYIEIWVLLGINKIHWIEIQNNQNIINEYVEQVNIDHLMDWS